MTSKAPIAALLAGALLAACSEKYAHSELGDDSPEARTVRQMVADLREAGEAGLDRLIERDGAGGLTGDQAAALRATLASIVQAERVELKRMDRFGEKVYRATLGLHADGSESELFVLLVAAPDGRLRWAGRN